ncbi:MAG: coenzyme F420-0:L-glutamate ligase [Acidobacteria bacterium]|nr:coenzyme F420-0:L-glutamate ligase [Acidobacteriota bacterium]
MPQTPQSPNKLAPDKLAADKPPDKLEIFAISGLPEVASGDPLAALLSQAMEQNGPKLQDGDVLVVAQKVVSKAEGRMVELSGVEPSPNALSLAEKLGKDARHLEVILRESKRIVRMNAGVVIVETHQGLVCANAGVDTSNVPEGWVSLLPADPDASARRLLEELGSATGKRLAVIISDTFGRPWREGLTNVAIGVAGFLPLLDYRGKQDRQGHSLEATVIATADELAAAAELVMGKTAGRPAALVRNFPWTPGPGKAADLIRPKEKDLFR